MHLELNRKKNSIGFELNLNPILGRMEKKHERKTRLGDMQC